MRCVLVDWVVIFMLYEQNLLGTPWNPLRVSKPHFENDCCSIPQKIEGQYLNCAEVHILVVKVSTLCQLWEVALSEAESEMQTHRNTLV